MQRIEKLFRWVNILVIIATIFAYLSPFVNPEQTWFLSFFGTGYSWLLLFNLLFILFWVIFKRWYFVFSLLTILIGWTYLNAFVGFNLSTIHATESSVSILSYNTEGFRKLVNKKDKAAQQKIRTEFFDWLNKDINPDIFCTQETGWHQLIPQNTQLQHKARNQGVSIFSKYPILNQGNINFKKTHGNACVWADIQLDQQVVRVYSVHFQSNRITSDTDKLIETADIQEKETWLGLKSILGKYKRAAVRRIEQSELVLSHIENSPYPVILCGDFNETPVSYLYKKLNTPLKDTFKESAWGIGTTFSGSIPGLKLDYILTNESIKSLRHDIIKDKFYSDHYPVHCLLEIE